VDTPRPSPRTNRTRHVPHPVLIGRGRALASCASFDDALVDSFDVFHFCLPRLCAVPAPWPPCHILTARARARRTQRCGSSISGRTSSGLRARRASRPRCQRSRNCEGSRCSATRHDIRRPFCPARRTGAECRPARALPERPASADRSRRGLSFGLDRLGRAAHRRARRAAPADCHRPDGQPPPARCHPWPLRPTVLLFPWPWKQYPASTVPRARLFAASCGRAP
jgi:hypothetical protein